MPVDHFKAQMDEVAYSVFFVMERGCGREWRRDWALAVSSFALMGIEMFAVFSARGVKRAF